MGNATNDDDIKLLNIWTNNQIILKERKCSAIFPLISRVNHNCVGNAHWIWNEKKNEQRLIALNDIQKDNEILVNYLCEPIESKQRKNDLKNQWNIDCECDWCKNDKILTKMDAIILEYQSLDKSLEGLVSKPLDGYKSAQKLVKIVEKHFHSNSELMYKHCYDAAQFALGLQKWSEASFYLETSMKEKQIARGLDVELDDGFLEKVNLLPTRFRSRFRKFDPKYRDKLNKNKNVVHDDDKKNENENELKQKQNGNGNVSKGNGQKQQNKNGKTQNGKKSNNKSNAKGKGKGNNRNNKGKQKKNKKKKAKK